MTSTFRQRPALNSSSKRPSSAIFIGQPNHIPDLPEPPSPGAASNGSGLPSPPATNSTGSGSTNAGSIRQQRPPSTNPNTTSNMLNGNYGKTFHAAFHRSQKGRVQDGNDDGNENDTRDDEDDTARLDIRRQSKNTSENVLALQRVKSLTQRNRMAIDKLTRISSPVPSASASQSTRPTPSPIHANHPPHASSSTSSSSRLAFNAPTPARRVSSATLSGSETEREQPALEHSDSSDELSVTPPTSITRSISAGAPRPRPLPQPPQSLLHPNSSSKSRRISDASDTRPRRTSAPTSPGKALSRTSGQSNGRASPALSRVTNGRLSPSVVRSPRRLRTSLDEYDGGRGGRDVTSAALAAVASVRGGEGNGSGKKTRGALPKEFRERKVSFEGRSTTGEPTTPHRERSVLVGRGSPSPSSSASSFVDAGPVSPRAHRATPSRASIRRKQWTSDDLSSISGSSVHDDDGDSATGGDGSGRRSHMRGGSGESPVSGRSLVGEGLRAAGLSMKRRSSGGNAGDDVFGNGNVNDELEERRVKRSSVTAPTASSKGKARERENEEWADEGESMRSRSRLGALSVSGSTSTRISEGVGPPPSAFARTHPEHTLDYDPRTPDNPNMDRARYAYPRSTTTLSHYNPDEPRTAPPSGRAHELYGTDRDRIGRQGAQSQQTLHERRIASPFGSRRHTTMTPLQLHSNSPAQPPPPYTHQTQVTRSEHGRLMMESLTMFESHLSRLPPMGSTTTSTIPELFRSAQNIVYASDKLNALLRTGTNRALEEQIDAEVGEGDGGGTVTAEVWRKVGGEYRESLRVSDELVRTMTGFLLGVGKVFKETAANVDGTTGHSRNVSLDLEGMRETRSPEAGSGGRRSVLEGMADGRRSVEGRKSREAKRNSELVGEALKRYRPASSLRARSTDREGHIDSDHDRQVPGSSKTGPPLAPSSSMRRLFTPRERREQNDQQLQQLNSNLTPSDSQETMQSYEPSPTPAGRQNNLERSRTLPPLVVPKPLPSLPSESILRRTQTLSTDKHNRRKNLSTTSATTVRAANPMPMFPRLNTPNATTAVTTHTVSNSSSTAFPMSRTESDQSNSTNFSRSATIAALTGLHQQDSRKRTISSTSANNESVDIQTAPKSAISGSETEREARRRTIGARSRVSFDGAAAADRGELTQAPTFSNRRERRRTITEMFTQD